MAELEYDRGSDGVATILLNRPERRNAFTREMLTLWRDALLDAAADDEVRCVVLRSAGESFCAGIDLDELEALAPTAIAQARFVTDHVQPVPRAAAALGKPMLAAVRGAAVGAGMDMTLACDMRFADRSARFRESYVHVGLVPGAGGAWFLPRVVGLPKAFELLLGGETVDAEEAHRIGLVDRLHADEEELLAAVYGFAGAIAAAPPAAVRAMKMTLERSTAMDLDGALELAASQVGILRTTDDSREALAAMRERRPPQFTGS